MAGTRFMQDRYNKIIGEFIDITDFQQGEYLELGFQPGSLPIKQRWRNNGLSADFLADYVTTFFPIAENDDEGSAHAAEIKHAVGFVANELLENGMKYADGSLNMPMRINMLLEKKTVTFNETNSVNEQQAESFLQFITRLQESDPMEMFVEQLERQALEEAGSGLGFLTMLNDYQADLSWRFQNSENAGIITITTAVKLPI